MFAINDNYKRIMSRGISSLSKTTDHIETYKNAMKLNGVGKFLANEMFGIDNNKDDCSKKSKKITTPRTASRLLRQCSGLNTSDFSETTQVSRKLLSYEMACRSSDLIRKSLKEYKNWKVILMIDQREFRSDSMQASLLNLGVDCEQRSLPIGDMLWISRGKHPVTGVEVEVMLGTIVERKTAEDLASSIFGSRYDEQRLRLQFATGISKVIYLLEASNLNKLTNCSAKTLQSAINATRLHLGFQILRTTHLDHTCQMLHRLHFRIIQIAFSHHNTTNLVFDHPPKILVDKHFFYNEFKLHIELVRERGKRSIQSVFSAMLKQIDGMSNKKVQAITSIYPTPTLLFEAYYKSQSEGQDFRNIIQDIEMSGKKQRASRIG